MLVNIHSNRVLLILSVLLKPVERPVLSVFAPVAVTAIFVPQWVGNGTICTVDGSVTSPFPSCSSFLFFRFFFPQSGLVYCIYSYPGYAVFSLSSCSVLVLSQARSLDFFTLYHFCEAGFHSPAQLAGRPHLVGAPSLWRYFLLSFPVHFTANITKNLKASAVEFRSILLIDTLDRHHDQCSIHIPINTRSELSRHLIKSRQTNKPVENQLTLKRMSTKMSIECQPRCRWNIDRGSIGAIRGYRWTLDCGGL